MTPQDKAAFNAAWAIYCQQVGRDEEWEFKAGFEAALVHRDYKDRANARLIAAAPDLLEVLQKYDKLTAHDGWYADLVKSVIVKATGDSDD